jgi:hypothetical protein
MQHGGGTGNHPGERMRKFLESWSETAMDEVQVAGGTVDS